MNPINPNKLMLSKWTARRPKDREKHFMVIRVVRDEDDEVIAVELEAPITGRSWVTPWRTLQNSEDWQMGWK